MAPALQRIPQLAKLPAVQATQHPASRQVMDLLEGFKCFAGGNPWATDVREIPLLARYESEM